MTARTIASIAAVTSLVFGLFGLLMPGATASAFGVEGDATAMGLVRMACASYIGWAVLAWLARDLSDAAAWRAVAASNAAAWGLSAIVVVLTVASGVGDMRVWIMVAIQLVFAVAWSSIVVRAPAALGHAA